MPPTTSTGRKRSEAQPAAQAEPAALPVVANPTTISVSPAFAEAVKEIARDEGGSVAAYLDREFLAGLQAKAADILRKRLNKMTSAGAGN